jgi:protein SCO1/2
VSPRFSGLVVALALALAGLVGVGGALLVIAAMGPTPAPAWTAAPIAWPGGAGASPSPSAISTEIVPPRPAPPLRLTGTDGQPFDLASLRGRPVLVFFGYTHCPDVCPTTLVDVRDAMKQSAVPFAAVFVSIDPERDTPAEMGTYLSYYGVPIVGLTGSPTEVRAAADAWGVRYARIDEGSASGYAMAHTADTFVIDGAGMLRHVIPFGAGNAVMQDRVAAVAAAPAPTPAVALASPVPGSTPLDPNAATPGPDGSVARPTGGIIPELMSTVIRAGRSRLVLEVMFPMQRVRYINGKWVALSGGETKELGRPDVIVNLSIRSLDRPADPPLAVTCQFIWVEVGSTSAYVAEVTFPSAGAYVATVTAIGASGSLGTAEMPITVQASAPVVAVGELAPSVHTPTAADAGGALERISTDPEPDPRFYATSVADLLAAHRPFVLTIYSPAFCPTTACGPLLRNMKAIANEFPAVGFVHAEPYVMENLGNRIQPALTGGLSQWAPWSVAYGIPVEPWTFVVGADGRVVASFEMVVGTDELRAAIRAAAGDD